MSAEEAPIIPNPNVTPDTTAASPISPELAATLQAASEVQTNPLTAPISEADIAVDGISAIAQAVEKDSADVPEAIPLPAEASATTTQLTKQEPVKVKRYQGLRRIARKGAAVVGAGISVLGIGASPAMAESAEAMANEPAPTELVSTPLAEADIQPRANTEGVTVQDFALTEDPADTVINVQVAPSTSTSTSIPSQPSVSESYPTDRIQPTPPPVEAPIQEHSDSKHEHQGAVVGAAMTIAAAATVGAMLASAKKNQEFMKSKGLKGDMPRQEYERREEIERLTTSVQTLQEYLAAHPNRHRIPLTSEELAPPTETFASKEVWSAMSPERQEKARKLREALANGPLREYGVRHNNLRVLMTREGKVGRKKNVFTLAYTGPGIDMGDMSSEHDIRRSYDAIWSPGNDELFQVALDDTVHDARLGMTREVFSALYKYWNQRGTSPIANREYPMTTGDRMNEVLLTGYGPNPSRPRPPQGFGSKPEKFVPKIATFSHRHSNDPLSYPDSLGLTFATSDADGHELRIFPAIKL